MSEKTFKLPHGSVSVAGVKDKTVKEALMKLNENIRAIEKELQKRGVMIWHKF